MTLQKFQNLEGNWKIKRNIVDIGIGEGSASFIKPQDDKNTLCYKEKLELYIDGKGRYSGVHQEYKFVYDRQNDVIVKYTSSSSLMYKFSINCSEASGEYLCNKDRYVANYKFIDENNFTLTYRVSGPNKDYTIITEFEKIDEYIYESSALMQPDPDII